MTDCKLLKVVGFSVAMIALAWVAGSWTQPAAAHSYTHSEIKIGHVWARPATGQQAEVFMPLYNGGKSGDRLTGAETARAASVGFRNEAGETVDGFALPPGRPLAMRPGKRALVLENIQAPLELGERFDLTLRFEKAGEIDVSVWVEESPSD